MNFFNPQKYSGVSWVKKIPPSKSLLWPRTVECWIFNIYILASIWWCSFCLWNSRVVKWNRKCYQSLYRHGGELEMIHGLWVWICRIHLNVLSLKEKVPMFYHPCLLSCMCLSKPFPQFLPPILFHQSWIWTSCDPASSSIFCYAIFVYLTAYVSGTMSLFGSLLVSWTHYCGNANSKCGLKMV